MKKKVAISGKMGNQLFKYCIAITNSMKNNYELEAVYVTWNQNRLIEMLELKVPAISFPIKQFNDIDLFIEENIHTLFRYRDRLFEEGWIKLKKVEKFINAETCIHLRGSDLKLAPLEWYCNKVKNASDKVHLCTDDIDYRNKFMVQLAKMDIKKDVIFTNQEDIKDWNTILGASKTYCASSFALSTLLFDPNKEMIFCSRKSSNPEFREGRRIFGYQLIETAMNYCPNLRLED